MDKLIARRLVKLVLIISAIVNFVCARVMIVVVVGDKNKNIKIIYLQVVMSGL